MFDVSVNEKIYDIGLILFDYVPEKNGMDVKRYLERFREYLASNLQTNVVMLAGKKVQDINSIAKSYGNTCMLRSFQGSGQRRISISMRRRSRYLRKD